MGTTSERRIVFLISRFLDGGIDTVLRGYLQHFAGRSDYRITLAIGTAMGDLEVYKDSLPPEVNVVYFVGDGWLTRWRQKKVVGRLPLYQKLLDEALLSPIRRWLIQRNLRRTALENDVVIDFDSCFYSYLKHIDTFKIAWFHFSFEQSLRMNHRRMLRIGRLFEHYDKVVSISKAMYDEGIRLFPNLKEKLCVIYNAKDRDRMLERSMEPVASDLIRQPFILAVERLEESQKDLTTMIRAFQRFKQQYRRPERLYIIGKGNSEGELRQLASELGIADDVVFLGFCANPYPWMREARLLVHSAKMEGLPTVLIEGLMLDKLIVATDCPTGPAEILDGGKAGVLVPVGDPQAMADAIHRVLDDSALQQQLLADVREHRRQFTFEATEVLFDEMINRGK